MYSPTFLLILLSLSFVSASPALHTPEVITVTSSTTTVPISFFNDEGSSFFTARARSSHPLFTVKEPTISVAEQSYGSFSLVFNARDFNVGLYFDTIIISKEGTDLFEVPVIFGTESPPPRMFGVSINFDELTDTTLLHNELTVSPTLNVYKLDYNPTTSNTVVLHFFVYDLKGNLLDSSQEVISVSSRSSFEHFSNLGAEYPDEAIFVADVTYAGSRWMDIAQVRLNPSGVALSPPSDSTYWIYVSVFAFLLASMIILSYFWHHRVVGQARDWRSRINYIKKTQFSDAAKALRKLEAQRNVLERAYASHYITKESYKTGLATIERLNEQLKKRL